MYNEYTYWRHAVISNSHRTCYSDHDIHVDNFGFTLSCIVGQSLMQLLRPWPLGLLMTPEKINDTSIQIALWTTSRISFTIMDIFTVTGILSLSNNQSIKAQTR